MPYPPIDDSLSGRDGLAEVVSYLVFGDSLVVEGIVLGLVVTLPSGLEEGNLSLQRPCDITMDTHGGGTTLLTEILNGSV